jgi:hypothetical protein
VPRVRHDVQPLALIVGHDHEDVELRRARGLGHGRRNGKAEEVPRTP